MHILLADDSKAAAGAVKAFLENLGHSVTCVHDGAQACEAFARLHPDMVLLDVVMPVMDGFEAARRIKSTLCSRWTPVLLMTALSSIEEIITGFEAGADDYLVKPFDSQILAARIEAMQRIATVHDSLLAVLNNVSEAIVTIDQRGLIESFNLAAERIFGYTPDEVIGHNVNKLMPAPDAQQHDGYLARYQRERTPHVIGISRKVRGLRKNGHEFPMRLGVTEVRRKDGSLFIGVVADITKEEAARQRIEFLALHDALTGLPNRTNFNETAALTLQQTAGQNHALLFIDLDGFKPINDQLGHDAGDTALKMVAARLRHNLAANDIAARLGGDEFVVLARDVANREAAQAIAQRLIKAIGEPMLLKGELRHMGASIGVAMHPEHGTSLTDLLSAADHAMYEVKRAGKGAVRFSAS